MCAAPFLGGAFLAYSSADAILQGWESESWPKAAATITKSSLETKVTQSNSNSGRSRNGVRNSPTKKTTYEALIEYTFAVGGKTYRGFKIHAGNAKQTSRDYNLELVNRYSVGSQTEVFYKAEDPNVSALQSGPANADFVMLVAGLILFGFGAFMIFRMLSAPKEDETIAEDSSAPESVSNLNVSSAFMNQLSSHDQANFDPTKKKTGT